ncbi:uncharacterized protein H6S33_007447 [Morchella sextelata]|uniref:uncharacterized protein n=1 Tax=Morchella sextelata TaxID=1174677 RepID=UPI001D056DB8|nr:uncharacterized protein H6S33_007447 [Morchella sextelata]KAH0603788.1 hypothetical protein H6S33_007447 [Morchella sextelata]
MTAQFLTNELTNLVQEAKRKNSDLRHAAEKSLSDLKSLSPLAEVAAELSTKPGFLSPFLIACGTRNAKFSTIGVVCLQRLILSRALAKSRLREVLEAFREAANLGVEIQLKILQALPPLLQNYAEDLNGNLLGEALLICSILQGSKMGVVNNTAAATLSQIVISIFDKVVSEDERLTETDIHTVGEAPCDDGLIPLRPAAFDAYRVFYDLCLLTEGHRPQFLRFNVLPQPFGLELIESVLTNHPDIFLTHPEQAYVLKTRVSPLIIRSLADRLNFPTTVRITRVLYILLRRHLSILSLECEDALNLLTQMLDPDASAPWKRALCMEVFRGICSEPTLVRKIFATYDAVEGRKPIMKELMGALTRLATERPSIIGLGSQSTVPVGAQALKDLSSEQAALEAGGVAGIIGGAVGLGEVQVAGLSTQWSLVRVPCIDQLDKSEPPAMPESYVYCLGLTCVNLFCEGLAKFILPLTIPGGESKSGGSKRRGRGMLRTGTVSLVVAPGSDSEAAESPRTPSPTATKGAVLKRKPAPRVHRIPINPLTLENHPLAAEITISAAIMEACWPAVLAACSTFLYATLDNEFYHGLVRSFQKFTHVAGLLRLTTPRDAFLTTLGKAAVPSNVISANVDGSGSSTAGSKGLLSVDAERGAPSPGLREETAVGLNSRNLLCLRALLNLGIALGPTLEKSWSILLETLQGADYVLFASSRKNGRQISLSAPGGGLSRTDSMKAEHQGTLMTNVGPELAAVELAAGKMFESTRDFPDDAFMAILAAMCKLSDGESESGGRASVEKPRSPAFPGGHKRIGSVSSFSSQAVVTDNAFALAKLGELAMINMSRLIGPNPASTGWDLLATHLATVAGSRDRGNPIRMKAAEVLNEVVVAAAKTVGLESTENVAEVQRRILTALREGVRGGEGVAPDGGVRATEAEIVRMGLEALNAILEHSGQSLIAGWEIVFEIITGVFDSSIVWRRDAALPVEDAQQEGAKSTKSPKLIRGSFSSLELICSDFLANLPTSCVLVLIDALFAFCSQKDDLNISLTTITFFWNVSDYLQTKGGGAEGGSVGRAEKEEDLLEIVEKGEGDSHSALWMLLLLRLTGVSGDRRAEVRNGSIQTLFRIFDTYGHQLGPQAWSSCLKIVVFKMMGINPAPAPTGSDVGVKAKTSEFKQWDDTINLVLSGIGTLYSNYFDIFAQQSEFRNTWSVFIHYLENLLSRRSFEVNTNVFTVLKHVLEKVSQPEKLDQANREDVWRMWSGQGIKLVEGNVETSRTGIQETLTAYVDSFKPLYRLLEPTLDAEMAGRTLAIMRECIIFPDAPSYFQDIDILTPLQAVILEVVQLLRTDIPDVPSLVLKQISEFSTVAYDTNLHAGIDKKGVRIPTYIALATQSMKIIETVTLQHIENREIYSSGALKSVLEALGVPISLKYNFAPQTTSSVKRPSQWIPATTVVLRILTRALAAMDSLEIAEEKVWELVIQIIGSVVSADTTSGVGEVTLQMDEDFDISSFKQLRELVVPRLGRSVVPDKVVNEYVRSVVRSSLLYGIGDLDMDGGALEGLKRRRRGITSELVLERRVRMSYVCLDELFELSKIGSDDSPELQRLAAAAAPFLVLRAGLVLQHYISDQPLRGRMPQPVVQRKEMLYVLKRLVNLESSSKSISKESHLPPSTKQHLFTLFPLISQCIAVAQGDQELLTWLSRALNEMGMAFGVC